MLDGRRQPGHLVPCSRRLEHVYAIALRNLLPRAAGAPLPPLLALEVLALGGGAPALLYRSESLESTTAPSWAPIDWALAADGAAADAADFPEAGAAAADAASASAAAAAAAAALRAPALRLRVLALPAGAPLFAKFFLAGGGDSGAPPAGASVLLERDVDLRTDVHFLGFDALDALAQMDPAAAAPGGGGGGSSGGGGGGGVAAQLVDGDVVVVELATGGAAPASAYNFDALPANFLLLALDDGHYVLRDAAAQLLGLRAPALAGAAAAPAAAPPPPPAGAARFDPVAALEGAAALVALRAETAAANAARAQTMREVASALLLAPGEAAAPAPAAAAAAPAAALAAALRAQRDALAADAAAAEASLRARSAALAGEAGGVVRALTLASRGAGVLPGMHAEVEAARGEGALLRALLSAKQLSLLAELRSLYPIEELVPEKGGRTFTIRGLHLPSRFADLAALPEEQVSTALGYACHAVQLAAKYLAVPLRYTPSYCASRSAMRDDVLRPGVDFPLHGKPPAASAPAAAADPFALAVLMLAKDVRQLLHSQGLAMGDAHLLAALRRLFATLLDTHAS
jgi:hypothetical protein